MSIYLVDNANDGHHSVYQNNLNNIKNTIVLNNIITFTEVKSNFIKAYNERKKFINYINSKTRENDIVHFLYIDSLYKCPFIDRKIKKNRKYIGTLHWVPKDIFRQTLLKKFSKKLEYIIVHSEFLKNNMDKIGVRNVKVIDYPSFLKIDNSITGYRENSNKIIISCLGGTRSDKGLDVLVDSFKYIGDTYKNKLVFNICGIEQDIKYQDIIVEAKINNIELIYKNKFLTEKEYEYEVLKSDVILLPYKSIFTGNSGPMTDGIYANKFILGPDKGNLGYLIKKHNLGLTFIQENSLDLAKRIEYLTKINLFKNHKYRSVLSVET
ncbi:MAG: hypothetical protein ACI33I_12205, partial [Clostridium sp.]